MWVLGVELGFLCWYSGHFTDWVISPVLRADISDAVSHIGGSFSRAPSLNQIKSPQIPTCSIKGFSYRASWGYLRFPCEVTRSSQDVGESVAVTTVQTPGNGKADEDTTVRGQPGALLTCLL